MALTDVPATADSFGGHVRVATAIRELIMSEPGGRAIGLEGGWGSGKSSVVQMIVAGLDDNTRALVFDAWAHEGDPLRRSFLEALIEDLVDGDWVDKDRWRNEVEELAGRRRRTTQTTHQNLTRNGRWLAASIFVVPVGAALLSHWLDAKDVNGLLVLLGIVITVFPLLLAFGLWLAGCRADGGGAGKKESHPLAILAKANTTTQETDTFETPEPTSIEFAQKFGQLMREGLEPSQRRLLIVLDNLDRVRSETASNVLATLQTFLGGIKGSEAWESRLWVLLPYDRGGLKDLWDDEDLVDQFLAKIRQLRFDTPPLVLSDWRGHVRQLLHQALPDRSGDELDALVRLVAAFRIEQSLLPGQDFAGAASPPTPRELVQIVNEIGSIHRQRQDVPLQHAGYFALLRWSRTDVALGLLEGRVPSSRTAHLLGDSASESLAALHFNVEAARANQLLLGEPLSLALVDGNAEAVQGYAAYPGFWEVLEALPFDEWADEGGQDLARAGSALDRAGVLEALPAGATQRLAGVLGVATSLRLESSQGGEGLAALLLAVSPSPASAEALLQSVSQRDPNAVVDAPELKERVLGIVSMVRRLDNETPGLVDPSVDVPGSAEQFLQSCEFLAQANVQDEFLAVIRPSVSMSEVVSAVAQWAGQPPAEGRSAVALGVATRQPGQISWKPAAQAFEAFLSDPNLAYNPSISLALECVDLLTSVNAGAAKRLAAQGWLLNACYLAIESGDLATAALAGFLHLVELPGLEDPPADGYAVNGALLVREALTEPGARPDLADALRRVVVDRSAAAVALDIAAAQPSAEGWARACIEELANSERLDADTVVARWAEIDRLADRTTVDALLARLTGDGSLLAATHEAAPGTASALETRVLALMEQDPEMASVADATRLRSTIVDRLREMSAEDWEAELIVEGASVELLRLVVNHQPAPDLGVPFQEALIRHGEKVASGNATISDPSSWMPLLGALAADHFRSAVANGLTSQIAQLSVPIEPSFFDAYGELLAREDQVLRHDLLVSSIFATAVRNDHPGTLAWARALVSDRPEVLESFQPQAKVDNLRALVEQQLIDGGRSDEMYAFASALGIEPPAEGTDDQAGDG